MSGAWLIQSALHLRKLRDLACTRVCSGVIRRSVAKCTMQIPKPIEIIREVVKEVEKEVVKEVPVVVTRTISYPVTITAKPDHLKLEIDPVNMACLLIMFLTFLVTLWNFYHLFQQSNNRLPRREFSNTLAHEVQMYETPISPHLTQTSKKDVATLKARVRNYKVKIKKMEGQSKIQTEKSRARFRSVVIRLGYDKNVLRHRLAISQRDHAQLQLDSASCFQEHRRMTGLLVQANTELGRLLAEKQQLKRDLNESKEAMANLSEQESPNMQETKILRDEKAELQKLLDTAKGDLKKAADLEEASEDHLIERLNEIKGLVKEKEDLEEQMDETAEELTRVRQELRDLQAQHLNVDFDRAGLKSEISRLEMQELTWTSAKKALTDENASLKSQNANLQSENENLKSEKENFKSENENLKTEQEILKSEKDSLQKDKDSLAEMYRRLQEENKTLLARRNTLGMGQANQTQRDTRGVFATPRNRRLIPQEALTGATEQLNKLRGELLVSQSTVATQQYEIDVLKAKNASLSDQLRSAPNLTQYCALDGRQILTIVVEDNKQPLASQKRRKKIQGNENRADAEAKAFIKRAHPNRPRRLSITAGTSYDELTQHLTYEENGFASRFEYADKRKNSEENANTIKSVVYEAIKEMKDSKDNAFSSNTQFSTLLTSGRDQFTLYLLKQCNETMPHLALDAFPSRDYPISMEEDITSRISMWTKPRFYKHSSLAVYNTSQREHTIRDAVKQVHKALNPDSAQADSELCPNRIISEATQQVVRSCLGQIGTKMAEDRKEQCKDICVRFPQTPKNDEDESEGKDKKKAKKKNKKSNNDSDMVQGEGAGGVKQDQ